MKLTKNSYIKDGVQNFCGDCKFFRNSPKKLGIFVNPDKNSRNIVEINGYSCKEVGRVEKDFACSTFLSSKRV